MNIHERIDAAIERGNGVLAHLAEVWDGGDQWGTTMMVYFPVAEIVRRATGRLVPTYFPSILEEGTDIPAEYGDDFSTTELWDGYVAGHLTVAEFEEAAALLNDLADVLIAEGKDY